ncbi:glutamate 5-kinase [Candidatus Dependentiae bacterium]|nr:glutamate 5-kinase [Candidatus Dependentiae bacterium]
MKTNKFELIKKSKNIVVKIGTSILTEIKNGYPQITDKNISAIIKSMSKHFGIRNFTIVSSGAVGFGMSVLNMKTKPKDLSLKQAAAAVGQNKLMQMYENLFSKYNKIIAQVLLTQPGMMDRQQYLNAINTLNSLFEINAIPIINENDTVAVDELKFGDNDKLAAMVGSMINADLIILLTNINGLLNDIKNPCSLIEDIEKLTPELFEICGCASKSTTTGGMKSKLIAADISMSSGIPMIIANGYEPDIIDKILNCKFNGTFFYPADKIISPRKRWIKFNLKPKGKIFVDNGAAAAIQNNKSLLASGITGCDGKFDKGDCVAVYVYDKKNIKIAVGLCNYNNEKLNLIKGLKTSEIKKIYGENDYPEVIHIDNMALRI